MYTQVSNPNQCLPSQSKNNPYMIHIYYIYNFPGKIPAKPGSGQYAKSGQDREHAGIPGGSLTISVRTLIEKRHLFEEDRKLLS